MLFITPMIKALEVDNAFRRTDGCKKKPESARMNAPAQRQIRTRAILCGKARDMKRYIIVQATAVLIC